MYVIYDSEKNEIEITDTLEKAEKIYESMKQEYYNDGWLPDEGSIPVTISKVIKSAKVVKSDVDDDGEQLYAFDDVIEETLSSEKGYKKAWDFLKERLEEAKKYKMKSFAGDFLIHEQEFDDNDDIKISKVLSDMKAAEHFIKEDVR